MKGSDRAVLIVIPLVALAIGFWLLVLGPKRAEISELDAQVADLSATISNAEGAIVAAEAARADYGSNYADVVSLGAAAPEESDQATFVYQLSTLADENSLQMRSFELAEGAGGEIAPAPVPAPAPAVPPAEGSEEGAADEAAVAVDAAAATEAAAATAPLGSSVGPAGLPLVPYVVRYGGSFFGVADLLGGIDSTVQVKDVADVSQKPTVQGRLVTIDGFALVGDPVHGFPLVQASLALTTFSVPSEQGLSAGATPAGPAPTESLAAPVAAPTSTASAGATAAVAP